MDPPRSFRLSLAHYPLFNFFTFLSHQLTYFILNVHWTSNHFIYRNSIDTILLSYSMSLCNNLDWLKRLIIFYPSRTFSYLFWFLIYLILDEFEYVNKKIFMRQYSSHQWPIDTPSLPYCRMRNYRIHFKFWYPVQLKGTWCTSGDLNKPELAFLEDVTHNFVPLCPLKQGQYRFYHKSVIKAFKVVQS